MKPFKNVRLYVMGRSEAADFTLSEPYIHIAVYTPGDVEVPLARNYTRKAALQLCFHDVSKVSDIDWLRSQLEGTGIEATPFSEDHAQKIVSFLKAHTDVSHIAVNCDAGMCRSPGIAAAISKFFTGFDDRFYQRYHPNHRVARGLGRALRDSQWT